MRGCATLAAARAALVALACGSAWAPGVALSSTKHTAPSPRLPFAYNTSGAVGIGAAPGSVSGPAVLQFQGVSGASFDPKSGRAIDLGQFVASPSSTALGRPTTYTGTPFEVEIQTPEFDKTKTVPVLAKLFPTFGKKFNLKSVVENSLLLKGHLDGTVGANGRANVTATVDSIRLGSIEAPGQDHATHYAFPIRFSQLKLPPSWTMSASAPITTGGNASPAIAPPPAAQMLAANPTPTPEPSTIVLFAVGLGGLVLGRRRLAAR
jgi:hypothetical protein